jgi:hypothetical protein
MPVPETLALCDGDAAVVVDASHPGVVISTWFGAPNAELVERYFEWLEPRLARFAADKVPYGLINDASEAGRPQPTVRRMLAERGDAASAASVKLMLGSYTVIENPLVRGVMTALSWVSRGGWSTTIIGSCGDAIERLAEDFDAGGAPFPTTLKRATYRRPSRPEAA